MQERGWGWLGHTGLGGFFRACYRTSIIGIIILVIPVILVWHIFGIIELSWFITSFKGISVVRVLILWLITKNKVFVQSSFGENQEWSGCIDSVTRNSCLLPLFVFPTTLLLFHCRWNTALCKTYNFLCLFQLFSSNITTRNRYFSGFRIARKWRYLLNRHWLSWYWIFLP